MNECKCLINDRALFKCQVSPKAEDGSHPTTKCNFKAVSTVYLNESPLFRHNHVHSYWHPGKDIQRINVWGSPKLFPLGQRAFRFRFAFSFLPTVIAPG